MGTDPPSHSPPSADALLHEQMLAMNEALILGSVHQHELAAAAERLNERLREEIRQREEAEGALRESEERFRSLFASTPMAVFACDHEGVIQQYNARAAELWGQEPVRGVAQYSGSLQLLLPATSLALQQESPMLEVLRTGQPALDLEVEIDRPQGSRIPVQASFAPLKNGAGETTGVITSFMDLTERKKMERRSLRAQRMESIGTLAGGIAHDLNNSLGPIVMSLDLLMRKLTDPQSAELLTVIESSAHRAADMVRRVLSFARGVEGNRTEVQIPRLIGEIETIVNDTFLQQIHIETRVPPGLWTVLGDSTQLYQVLLNLCLNARDAMPRGGWLLVSAENREVDATHEGFSQNPDARPGPYIVLQVKDAGLGMAPAVLEKIFDPFFTTKEFGQGSGLGLPTSLAIVKSHGGFFHVTSELGIGTTFQVFIPAQTQAASPAAPPPIPEMPRGSGELILVVDDEAPMRQMTRHVLELFGYRVVLASHGAEAVDIYKGQREEIAAVITDMTMPGMEGPEVIRILRAIHPQLPIIAVSGLASGIYTARLAGLGVGHILSKPYVPAALLKMLRQVLADAGPAAGHPAPDVLP